MFEQLLNFVGFVFNIYELSLYIFNKIYYNIVIDIYFL